MKRRAKIARKLGIDRLVKWLGLYGTLDTEKALRAKQDEINRLREALAKATERVTVHIDPVARLRAYEQSNWYDPDKHTDPFASAHQQLQARRALMRHNTGSIARKIQLINDEEATQYHIPAFLQDQTTRP